MSGGKWWEHAECDRAEAADKCLPCLLWASGLPAEAMRHAALAEAEEEAGR